MYIAESNVFFNCILCLCIVTVVLLLYLAIWATISLNTLHFTSPKAVDSVSHNKLIIKLQALESRMVQSG